MPCSATARVILLALVTAVASAGLLAAPAGAADLSPLPRISTVKPMSATVGQQLTITGKNFVVGRKKNTVVFKRDGAVAVFVKADKATKTRLVVTIPNKLLPYFPTTPAGKLVKARFRLRVISRRFGKAYTTLRRSPTIAPALADDDNTTGGGKGPGPTGTPAPAPDCDKDGVVDTTDADDDNDYLADELELRIKTDPCKADTDGDSIEDGYEYVSALDLNDKALPYPGKRPYPNPLDASDLALDHDGDSLLLHEEHGAWKKYGSKSLDLNYSAGTQTTKLLPAEQYRGFPQDFNRDGVVDGFETGYLDRDKDGNLRDDEKDVDGDGLSNYDETHGRLNPRLIDAFYKQETKADPNKPSLYYRFGKGEGAFQLTYAQPDFLDPDSDGDTLIDGLDDQDHDDISNLLELSRVLAGGVPFDEDPLDDVEPPQPLVAWVNPYNPCLPNVDSRTCPFYVGDWAPVNGHSGGYAVHKGH